MTTSATPAPPSRSRRRPPSPLIVVTGTLGLFLVLLTLLAFQVRAGKDPSLSQGAASGSSTPKAGKAAAAATKSVVTKTS